MGDDIKLKAESLLRRAGLSHVNKSALCCILVLAVVLVGFALWRFWPAAGSESFSLNAAGADAGQGAGQEVASGADAGKTSGSGVSDAASGASGGSGASAASGQIAVDVEGAVCNPGLYRLETGARVDDAVEAAGGLCEDAVASQVNRAQKLEDGAQVYVPREGETASGSAAGAASGSSSGGSSAAVATQKVNINTATSEQLQTLQGVGEGIAGRIIDYREKNGSFKKIEDLKNVSGIGDARFAAIEDSITV